ncbi:poly(A) RNA polymerase GLD2 isoform X2 [Perca flavescens]|uniref:poly(A) RNA polymerase GLD2 isoform X2 n=1 Tax=Perca flavescens TaxID=8167 RepID=UPI00106E7308|nr:poly(A) RNA polymerase GLD2 isoform X2 [Perca flavescens]
MFPRSAAPRGRSAYRDGLYPTPPVPICYDYNHQRLAAVNSFYVSGRERLPTYEWKPYPALSPVPPRVPAPYTPTIPNGRKRQNDEYSPHVVKRQRLESPSHTLVGSPLPRATPPRRPDQAVPGSSRSSFGFDSCYPSPRAHIHPQVKVVPESSNSLQAYAKDKLSEQMLELFEACQQQTSDLARKETCRTRLQKDIQSIYAVARLYLTGSSMNGLGCRSSDADLCLVLKGNNRPDPINVLTVLQRLFKSLSYVERTQLIRAKVPILRFREKGSDLEFDLNINNTVGIRNTFLLRSYAYALKEPVLPSLQRDYPECFYALLDIDMVPEGPKHVPPYISTNQSSLGELLLGFLKYYATDFRWDKQVISVREAKALPKNNSKEWRNKYICVEEPFEKNNVARAVHEKIKFDAIKATFAESCRILQDRKDLNSIIPVRAIINKESSRR